MFTVKGILVHKDIARSIYNEALNFHYETCSGIIEREVATGKTPSGEPVFSNKIFCKSCGEQFKNIAKARVHYRKKNCHDPASVVNNYKRHMHKKFLEEEITKDEFDYKAAILNRIIHGGQDITQSIIRRFELFKQHKKESDISMWIVGGKPNNQVRQNLIEFYLKTMNCGRSFNKVIAMPVIRDEIEKYESQKKLKREEGLRTIAELAVKNCPSEEEILKNKNLLDGFDPDLVKGFVKRNEWDNINKLMHYKWIGHNELRRVITEHIVEQKNQNAIFDYFFDNFAENKDESLEQLQEHVNVSIAMDIL